MWLHRMKDIDKGRSVGRSSLATLYGLAISEANRHIEKSRSVGIKLLEAPGVSSPETAALKNNEVGATLAAGPSVIAVPGAGLAAVLAPARARRVATDVLGSQARGAVALEVAALPDLALRRARSPAVDIALAVVERAVGADGRRMRHRADLAAGGQAQRYRGEDHNAARRHGRFRRLFTDSSSWGRDDRTVRRGPRQGKRGSSSCPRYGVGHEHRMRDSLVVGVAARAAAG